VSEPRAVATGSYAQLSQNLYFVSLCLIRSLPLAVLTRLVATLTFSNGKNGNMLSPAKPWIDGQLRSWQNWGIVTTR